MNKLTGYQRDFLLEYFFKNEKYLGWKNIAIKLLENSNCIVPEKDCIWIGGIGNFIKTSEAKNAVDCLLYEFNLDYFLTSEWYKQISKQYIEILSERKEQIEQEYEDISNL